MFIYRPHRGSLSVSMKEAKVFNTEDEMKSYIADYENKSAKHYGLDKFFDVSDIVIDDDIIVNDDRIGWEDTRYVCTKRFGHETYETPQCIGYCATKFPQQNKGAD